MPIRFVWGVEAIDNGKFLDPADRGELQLDASFNMSSPEAQLWLLNFCRDFKKQPFYQPPYGSPIMHNCFIETVVTTLARRCIDPMSGLDHRPCCETATFPYEAHIFDRCLPGVVEILYNSPHYVFVPGVGGPKFARDSVGNGSALEPPPVVRALVVEFESNQSYSMSYTELAAFQTSIESWFEKAMASAPAGMNHAWFISELGFFDLQATLSQDTINAIICAMGVALLVLFLITCNLLISMLAILTVTFSIFSTIAILVLMGWKLNVLESIAISTAIGLSIDFSLHYGNNYRTCKDNKDRLACVQYSMRRMVGPTAMAALTTGAAGAFMLPSRVLAYIQIGKFLVIVMAVSWVYATFFMMSTLRVAGPQNGFGQLKWKKTYKFWRRGSRKEKEEAARANPEHR